MGLSIERITCRDFRSYEQFELDGIGGLTLIVGPNAVGKTNLLEGIQLITACSSFRNPSPGHLVRDGQQAGMFSARLVGDGRSLETDLRVSRETRSFFVNGKKKRPRDIRGTLPSVLFSPEDLELAKGSQGYKRAQIDLLGAQLSANYHAVRKDYEKILRQKNRYLKENVAPLYLQSINEVVASIGSQLYRLRCDLLSALSPYLRECYAQISGGKETVEIAYVPSWLRKSFDLDRRPCLEPASRSAAQECLAKAMERSAVKEHERRMSLFGPQLDMIEFYLDGRNVQQFASQGQQRTLVLAFKMAQVSLIAERLGQNPVLLLDDVMSELDSARRDALLSLISGNVQTFVTATNAEAVSPELAATARIVRIGGEPYGEVR